MAYRKSPAEQFLLLITLECGHNCPDCLYAEVLGQGHMPFKMVKEKIAPHIKTGHHVTVAGGEPTIHPNYWRIIKVLASKKPEYLQVITNGVSFSNSKMQATEFASRLDKMAAVTHTPLLIRVSVDDFHAKRLKGGEVEMARRVKVIRGAFKKAHHVGLSFCAGLKRRQSGTALIKKYHLPREATDFFLWQRGRFKQAGTEQKMVITPKGVVYSTEQKMLLRQDALGRLRGKTSLGRIVRKRRGR